MVQNFWSVQPRQKQLAGGSQINEINLLQSNQVLRQDLKQFPTKTFDSSIRGHFLLLRYPPPTKGWSRGTGFLDLYQAGPFPFALSSSSKVKLPTIRARFHCNFQIREGLIKLWNGFDAPKHHVSLLSEQDGRTVRYCTFG